MTTRTATTIETITDEQITSLRDVADAADDFAQHIICDIALDEDSRYDAGMLDEYGRPDDGRGGYTRSELRAIRRAVRMTRDEARAECVRVIRAVEAMQD